MSKAVSSSFASQYAAGAVGFIRMYAWRHQAITWTNVGLPSVSQHWLN